MMSSRFPSLILFSSLLAMIAASVLSTSPAEARFKSQFENKFSFTPTYYFQDIGQGTTQFASVLREEPDFNLKNGRAFRARFAPYVYADPSAASTSEKFIFDVNEASLDFSRAAGSGDVDLKIGISPVVWGVTDFYNPLDVVSAHRYFDLMNSERRGTPAVQLGWDDGVWHAEGIYIPVQFESIVPGDKSRWLPRDVAFDRSTSQGRIIFNPGFEYAFRERAVIDDALSNNFGFRLERKGSGLDLTAIFFQGSPTAPAMYSPLIEGTVLDVTKNISLADRVTLQPTYYLRRTAGIGAVWTLESLIVRAALANSDRLSTRSDLPGWSQSAVLGLEKNFAVGEGTLTMLAQATRARHEEEADNTITSLDRIFDASFLLGARYSTSTDWSVNAAVLYDSAFKGLYAVTRGEYKIRDGLTGSLQVDVLEGDSGTPLGSYSKNDRATLGLSYFF